MFERNFRHSMTDVPQDHRGTEFQPRIEQVSTRLLTLIKEFGHVSEEGTSAVSAAKGGRHIWRNRDGTIELQHTDLNRETWEFLPDGRVNFSAFRNMRHVEQALESTENSLQKLNPEERAALKSESKVMAEDWDRIS